MGLSAPVRLSGTFPSPFSSGKIRHCVLLERWRSEAIRAGTIRRLTDNLLKIQSTFHKCWHSPDKNKVLLRRSNQSPFLMAPIGAFVFVRLTKSYTSNSISRLQLITDRSRAFEAGLTHRADKPGAVCSLLCIWQGEGVSCGAVLCRQVRRQTAR